MQDPYDPQSHPTWVGSWSGSSGAVVALPLLIRPENMLHESRGNHAACSEITYLQWEQSTPRGCLGRQGTESPPLASTGMHHFLQFLSAAAEGKISYLIVRPAGFHQVM